MIVLMLSVFFSGFVLPVDEFRPIARTVSYLLPVTYGIELMHDVMLRGGAGDPMAFTGLIAIGAGLYLLDVLGLRRVMRRAA
jgi:ABC-2 type transport system permease protein